MRKLILATLVVLACATSAFAQSIVVNPTTVEFQASPDHAGKWLDGTDKVTGYRADYFLASDTTMGTPAATVSLNKPTPDATGKVSVSTSAFPSALAADVVYKVIVVTVGPSGSTRSAASGPFGFETRVAPSPASAVVVR